MSDKHGPRLDEDLKEAAEPMERGAPSAPHTEEFREEEPAEESAPPVDPLALAETGDERLSAEEVRARTELARHLRPAAFPGDRDAILAAARDDEAPDEVLDALNRLPERQTFQDAQDVWRALGGDEERRS